MNPMAIMAGMSAVGNIASSIFGSNKAADAQKDALKFAKRQAAQARTDFAPYRNAGTSAMPALLDALGLGDSNRAINTFEGSPAYRLLYDTAMDRANEGALSMGGSRGSLNSGATLKALQDRAQTTTRGFWGDYLSGIGNLANMGQSAAAGSANVSQNLGSQGAGILSGIGDTRAAGWLGAGNAFQSGLGSLAEYYGSSRGKSLYGGGPNLAYRGPGGTLGGGV